MAPSHDGVLLESLVVLYIALQAHSTLDCRTQFGPYSNPTVVPAHISVILVHFGGTGKEWYADIMIRFHTLSISSRAMLLAYAKLIEYNLVAYSS